MIIGIEVGGTFTDLVIANADGSLTVHKLPSTPSDPSVAAAEGLEAVSYTHLTLPTILRV